MSSRPPQQGSPQPPTRRRSLSRRQEGRAGVLAVVMAIGFLAVAGQLARLAVNGAVDVRLSQAEAIGRTTSRPNIVDRNGRLLATDITVPSLIADPHYVQDIDEAVEQLTESMPGLAAGDLRKLLANRQSRFAWLKRGVRPDEAQKVFNLGLPGIGFRDELVRVYPAAELTGHLLGAVDRDNRGLSGLEGYIDKIGAIETVDRPVRSTRAPLQLSIDLAAENALRSELKDAIAAYGASGGAGLVLDIETGEVLAASSLPDFASGDQKGRLELDRIDRVNAGVYELGSVFKTLTLAMALDSGEMTLQSTFDTTQPIAIGGYRIDDDHPTRRLLSFEEVFLKSSNIGASQMADQLGEEKVREFLGRLGLFDRMETEAGRLTPPQTAKKWGRIGTMTASFGHGVAVTPLQFAAAAAVLFNGGIRIKPTYLKVNPALAAADPVGGPRLVKAKTVSIMRNLMRANVADKAGTGGRADVPGYAVGGKTGTADIAGPNGYGGSGVLTSFLAVFPAGKPKYLTYVLLFQPKATAASGNLRTAAVNAAPTTARIIARIAPILGLKPDYPDDAM